MFNIGIHSPEGIYTLEIQFCVCVCDANKMLGKERYIVQLFVDNNKLQFILNKLTWFSLKETI